MRLRAVAAAAVLTLSSFTQVLAQDSGVWRDFMPPLRRDATLVHDTLRDRYVMFGGVERLPRNEVFQLSAANSQWTQLAPLGSPPAQRSGSASAYDPLHDRIWIYGGQVGSGPSTGLFGLDADPDEWVQLNTDRTSPPGRVYSSMVYDAGRDRLIQFGGLASSSLSIASNEVSWIAPYSDEATWTRLIPAGTPPAQRWGSVVALDRVRDRLVVIGGRSRDSVFTDAWELKFAPFPMWNRILTVGSVPPARDGLLGALDVVNDRIVTFGGASPATKAPNHDVWIFHLSGLNAWERIDPTGEVPDALIGACAVMDSARGRIVVHGGGLTQLQNANYESNETRVLDVRGVPSWGRITPSDATPQPRYGTGTAYDRAHDAFWIFGGLTSKNGANVYSDELWRRGLGDAGTWTLFRPEGPAPAGRQEPSLTYDARANRLYVFGGWDGTNYFDDTWTLDPAGVWRPVAPSGGPTGRRAQATAWDTSRRAMFVYGGTNRDSVFGDAWELTTDGSIAWHRINATGDIPPARAWSSVVYDPFGDRMIVYGGIVDGNPQEDIWALSLGGTPRWSRLEPRGDTLGVRARHAAAYDPFRRRMLVWGGYTLLEGALHLKPGTSALALDGDPAWSILSTTGPEPPPAAAPAMVYDVRRDRMTTYGGTALFNDLLPDLRALEFGGVGNANEAWLDGARIEGSSIRLAWQTLAPPGTLVTIEKRVDVYGDEPRTPFDPPVGTWATLGTTTVASDGSVSWIDTHVGSGGSYSYRLVVGGQVSEAASLIVPASVTFAFESALPSPTTGPLVLAIRSTGAAPVWASLYDVQGRRVLTRELGVLPAGVQSVPLELGLAKAGVYFVRVSQGGSASTRKIVLL